MACTESDTSADEWPKVSPLPKWWRLRDRLSPGAVWHHHKYEDVPGSRRWLERWMRDYIESLKGIEDLVQLGNSLRYFSPELFWRMQPVIRHHVLLLYYQGERVDYPTRTIWIMLPTLIEIGILNYVCSY